MPTSRGAAISVIIPVFDAERHLAECLDAALAQEMDDLEIVAVDDGSRDRSAAMLSGYRARDARVHVFTRANGGPSAARNTGLGEAAGDYVWFVDADDSVMPGSFERLAAVARGHDADIVTFNAEHFGDDGRGPMYRRAKPAGVVTGEAWLRRLTVQRELLHYPWLQLYRRELLLRHRMRFAEGILHEDIGWCTEALLHAQRVVHVDAILYRYRRHSDSLTGGGDDANLIRRIESYFTVVSQLRSIRERCATTQATKRLLCSEIVGQALQVDRLRTRLADPALRAEVRARCRSTRFWENLWPDATDWKRRRQLAKVLLRQRLGLP